MTSRREAAGPPHSDEDHAGYRARLGLRLGFTLPIALLLLALWWVAEWLGPR